MASFELGLDGDERRPTRSIWLRSSLDSTETSAWSIGSTMRFSIESVVAGVEAVAGRAERASGALDVVGSGGFKSAALSWAFGPRRPVRVGRGRSVARMRVVVSGRSGIAGLDLREAQSHAARAEWTCLAFRLTGLPRCLPQPIVGRRFRDRLSPRVCSRRSSFRGWIHVPRMSLFPARSTRLILPRFPRLEISRLPARPSAPHPSGAVIIQRVCDSDRSSWPRKCWKRPCPTRTRPFFEFMGLDARTKGASFGSECSTDVGVRGYVRFFRAASRSGGISDASI